ncbi:MAG: sulfur carrier protein ThiS [Candidatus Hydrogenedens sp.]|nr:sulfur carrier protein ThiS [Candidatus Hydrogenedens sp.]
MTLTVNGESREFEEGTTLATLVESLELKAERLVALVNEDIVERSRFSETPLSDGDTVELVTFLPGG